MKREGLLKPLAVTFVLAVVLYALTYTAIEHRRNHKGPWQVEFTTDAKGAPALIIHQPALAITNVRISFSGEAVPPGPLTNVADFHLPRPVPFPVPFGRCIFMDTTFLPGTLVFELFGHEIQLIPRALRIDRKEQAWESNRNIPIASTNLSSPPAL